MAVKPDLPKWVPGDEAARITDPGTAKRALGWIYLEKPAFQFMNWIHNIVSHWLLGVQGSFFDIVVGSATQVTDNEATHEIADLDDALVIAGSKVMLLDGTHTLAADLSLSNVDIVIVGESPLAIIDVATFQILLTGDRQQLKARVTNAGVNDIQVTGAGSHFEGIDVDIDNVQTGAGSTALTSGTESGLKIKKILASFFDINWISAVQIGNDLVVATVGIPALAALNGTDVAFIDSTNDALRTYRFDGADWLQVGNSLAITTIAKPALAALNGTDVAFIDDTNDALRTYRFDGTDWAQVGNSLAIATSGPPALAALNGTDVAFIDSTNDALRTYRFDGTDWAQVGNDLNIAGVVVPALAALNGTDVAFIDDPNDDLRTYRFDGTDWAQVGNDMNIASVGTPALTALNGTDVAFIDSTNDALRTYRFDGADWVQIGNSLAIATVGSPALAALNGTDIAFIDGTNDDLRTYRFSFYLGDGPYHP